MADISVTKTDSDGSFQLTFQPQDAAGQPTAPSGEIVAQSTNTAVATVEHPEDWPATSFRVQLTGELGQSDIVFHDNVANAACHLTVVGGSESGATLIAS